MISANDDPEAKAMLERALTSLSNIDSISTNSKGKSKAIEKDDDVSSDSDSDSSISSSSSSSSSSSDSDSDSDSDSSSTKNPQILPEDFDSDLDSDSDNPRKNKKKSGTNQEEGETEIQTGPITANEIVPKLSVPKIKVLEPEVEIRYLGKVHSIVDSVVVVEQDVVKKSNGENGGAKRRNWNEMDQRPIDRFGKKGEEVDQYSVLDTDSLLALEDRTVVGLVSHRTSFREISFSQFPQILIFHSFLSPLTFLLDLRNFRINSFTTLLDQIPIIIFNSINVDNRNSDLLFAFPIDLRHD